MALFGFGKDKAAPPPPPPSRPVGAAPAAPAGVTADDFFGDIDKKAAAARKQAARNSAVTASIDSPEVTGKLREAPPPDPVCTINNLATETLSTAGLRDKTAEYDGLYHGNMGDIDESTIDVGTLRPEMAAPVPDESGDAGYSG